MPNTEHPLGVVTIQRALLSVWDKKGLIEMARGLVEAGIELLATGGTARRLAVNEIPFVEVAKVTGAPEILGGRVKTLHPAIHAGLLAKREQRQELEEAGYRRIGLVVVNLYPFEKAYADGVRAGALLEMIDIGGPTMLRAAAKNHPVVGVVSRPADYGLVLDEIREHGGLTAATRVGLAREVFATTAAYDAAIAAALTDPELLPDRISISWREGEQLRYGENPHQQGALYQAHPASSELGTSRLLQVSGQPLSYTNYLDLDSALRIALSLPRPGCAVLKHTNPCGAATADSLEEAFVRAYAGDSMSAFGGVVAVTDPLDAATARQIVESPKWFELILAPSFTSEAMEIITGGPKWGKRVRLMAAGETAEGLGEWQPGLELRTLIGGGLLMQDADVGGGLPADASSVTSHPITDAMRADLDLAWRLVGHIKSNAIVLVRDRQLVGMGAGQPSRVDASEIAVRKAGERSHGAVLASDAFFPFADGVEAAVAAGVVGVVQPGGSRRDDEVVAAAEKAGIPMVMTGTRQFRH